VINIGGKSDFLRFNDKRHKNEFFTALRPGKYLVDAADKWLASIDWGTPNALPNLAVHSRSFWEGRRCSNAYDLCAGKVQKQLHALMPQKTPLHHEVASAMCFVTPPALNLVLERSGEPELAVKNCSSLPNSECRPWLLAADGQTAGIIEGMAKEHGAHMFDIEAARARGDLDRTYRDGAVKEQHSWKHLIQRLEGAYIDIYLLTKGRMFIGNVFSTFSSTVCKMRPKEAPSNVCQILTTGKADPFMESLRVHGLPSGWHLPWEGDSPMARRIVSLADTKDVGNKCLG